MSRPLRAHASIPLVFCLLSAGFARQARETAARADGAYTRSVELARQALSRRPGDAGLLRVLASIHFRQGRFREAIAAFQDVLRVNPASLEARLGVAQSHFQLEELDAAERELRQILGGPESPQTAQSRRDLAEILFRRGQHAEAAQLLRAAIERGDRTASMWFLLGRALEARARDGRRSSPPQEEVQRTEAEAVAALQEALRIEPATAQAHFVLASIARRQGDLAGAAAALDAFKNLKAAAPAVDLAGAAQAESTFESRTAIELGRALLAARDLEGARAMSAHALKVEPGSIEAQAFSAWTALQSGETEAAADAYRRILERDPRHAESLWNLGRIHMKAGDLQAAAPLLLQAAEARPGFAEAWELLLKLAEEHGILTERVEELARRALQARPSAANHAKLAMVLFTLGKLDECARVIDEGLRRHPQDPDLLGARAALREAKAQK